MNVLGDLCGFWHANFSGSLEIRHNVILKTYDDNDTVSHNVDDPTPHWIHHALAECRHGECVVALGRCHRKSVAFDCNPFFRPSVDEAESPQQPK